MVILIDIGTAGSDLTGITIPDPGKVRVSFTEAKDDSGVDLMTDRAGTYHAKYHVDVMSGHPSYSIMRNITVELFKPPVHEEEGADDDSDIPGALPRDEESEDTAPAEEKAAGTTSEETVQDAPAGTESEVSPAESEEETPVKEEGVSEESKEEMTDGQEDGPMAAAVLQTVPDQRFIRKAKPFAVRRSGSLK